MAGRLAASTAEIPSDPEGGYCTPPIRGTGRVERHDHSTKRDSRPDPSRVPGGGGAPLATNIMLLSEHRPALNAAQVKMAGTYLGQRAARLFDGS